VGSKSLSDEGNVGRRKFCEADESRSQPSEVIVEALKELNEKAGNVGYRGLWNL